MLIQKSAFIYWARVWHKRLLRMGKWYFYPHQYALSKSVELFPFRYIKHSSKLIKNYQDSPEYHRWQINKITNLSIAVSKINGVLIKPGQIFSFWRLVGRPTEKKGYLEGMELHRGVARAGIAGGLCQLSNLLNWMTWHTPLEVIQRSTHSFDPFPDQGRVLPFGSGSAVFWNYVDLQIQNNTSQTFQILVWLTDHSLKGKIRGQNPKQWAYSVMEKEHFFIQHGSNWYRYNQIWRQVFQIQNEKRNLIREEHLASNKSKVMYTPNVDLYKVRTD
ncbi:MAG: hypothetical protein BGO07_01350 [Alphaproteobacteria bacterium 40-19]|nr:MAG: hypothetical protein BGO07_01350 [Alphaproteobacteria bacterium 40-19]